MKRLEIFFLCAIVSLSKPPEVCGGECVSETLSDFDAGFCSGGLEVIYPDVTISECSVIPRGRSLREKISSKWGAPRVRLASAAKKKSYVLVMVDPDAPSRCSPARGNWRHWVVTDILGADLQKGDFKGLVLSEYYPPTPPKSTGLHRYQFLLFEQPAGKHPSLSQAESSSRGNWDWQAFVNRFDLGKPLASVQFLTQNFKDQQKQACSDIIHCDP